MKYKCPCCGYYTFKERPNGNYDICPVCFWEDDPIGLENPDECCCCNRVSLHEAKRNFIQFGACREDMKIHVRPPREIEKYSLD